MVTRGPERWAVHKNSSKHPSPIIHGQKIGQVCPIQLNQSKRSIGLLSSRSSTMQRKVRRINCVPLDDTIKNATKKLEVQVGSAMPCKSRSKSGPASTKEGEGPIEIACDSPYGETRRAFNSTGKHDTHASLRPSNPRERASKETQQKRS